MCQNGTVKCRKMMNVKLFDIGHSNVQYLSGMNVNLILGFGIQRSKDECQNDLNDIQHSNSNVK